MKILVISPDFPSVDSIDFIFVEELCKTFVNKGHEIVVIAPQSISKVLFKGKKLVKFENIVSSRGGTFKLYRPWHITLGLGLFSEYISSVLFNFVVNLTANIIKFTPDICYGHFWHSAFAISRFAINKNIPLFVASGEENIRTHFKYSVKKLNYFLDYLSGIIAVSTKVKNEIIEMSLTKDDKCIVIPNSIDSQLFRPLDKDTIRKKFGISKKDFIVIYVGQFSERKGGNRLSNALNLLNDNNIKGLFIGRGAENPDYANTLFKGSVSHNLLAVYLNCADIFVLPTLNEGCSNAIVEALACGLPIVSSDLPFNHDILNVENSILVDPYDISAIANAIKLLKDNSEKRRDLSIGAIKTSLELTLELRAMKILEYIRNNI